MSVPLLTICTLTPCPKAYSRISMMFGWTKGSPAEKLTVSTPTSAAFPDRLLCDFLVHEECFARTSAHLAGQVAVLAQGDVHAEIARKEGVRAATRAGLPLERFAAAHVVPDFVPAGLTLPLHGRSTASRTSWAGGA